MLRYRLEDGVESGPSHKSVLSFQPSIKRVR
jgi:hypothetical protein